MTVLDSLIENAGQRFQRSFADEPLLERLRVCATDGLSDPEVKRKCQILFRQWAVDYKSTAGLERVVALQQQLPKYKKPVTQANSKVLKETEPSPNEDPFGSTEDNSPSSPTIAPSPSRPGFGSSSSSNAMQSYPPSSLLSLSNHGKKSKSDKSHKKSKHKGFNLEKEKPQILQAIASASISSTNLMNALKLIDREHKRVSEDAETTLRFENCKQLRRQILRYIQHIESEQWLGSLINANDTLVDALIAFEILDKSVDNDSDSEDIDWSDNENRAPPRPSRPREKSLDQSIAGLSLGKLPARSHPTMMLNDNGGIRRDDDTDNDEEEDDPDDPFGDSNAVNTPGVEKQGMAWRDV